MSSIPRAMAPVLDPDFHRADLYKALDCAQSLGMIKRAVRDTAKQLVRFIPINATSPISPVRVNRLAAEEGCNVRTIHRHINALIALGLAQNRALDGGHRSFDHNFGSISFIAGIDLGPLITHLPQLLQDCALREAERAEQEAIRKRISVARRQIKVAIGSLECVPEAILTDFEALPRRVADMGMDDLLDLYAISVDMLAELKVLIADKSDKKSDQSDKTTRPYTNTKESSVYCNEGKPLIKNAKEPFNPDLSGSNSNVGQEESSAKDMGQPPAPDQAQESEAISLDLVVNAAPNSWIEDIEALYGVLPAVSLVRTYQPS